MAETHLPAQPSAGWTSGPSASFEAIDAGEVRRDNRLVLDDATIVTIVGVTFGDFWLATGNHGYDMVIHWQQIDGNASGTLFRACGDTLHRIRL
jgi:hypothetical protein